MSRDTSSSGVQALEWWLAHSVNHYPGVSVTNMTSSWRDGLAFCALLHRYRPHLLDFSGLDTKDWLANLSLAFGLAEQELGIPSLLEPGDVVRRDMDRLSMITYLAQFYHVLAWADSGISSLSQSPASSDTETEAKTVSRRSRSSVTERGPRGRSVGAVLSLMLESTEGLAGRRARSRARTPPIEQENPFRGLTTMEPVVVVSPCKRQVLRCHRGRQGARRQVKSMYVAPTPDPGAQEVTGRPRSMLQGHTSYARPYRSQILVGQESLVSSVYRSRSHSFPRLVRQTPTEEKATTSDFKAENKPESEDSDNMKLENKLASSDCIETNQVTMPDHKESDKMLATNRNRRFSGSIKNEMDVGDCPRIKESLSRTKVNFFEKTKQTFGTLTYQHLHKSSVGKPKFSFLQTLV